MSDEQFFIGLLGEDAANERKRRSDSVWREVERRQDGTSWVSVPRHCKVESLFLGYLATVEGGDAGAEHYSASAKHPGIITGSVGVRLIEFDTFRQFAEWHQKVGTMPLRTKTAYNRNCAIALMNE